MENMELCKLSIDLVEWVVGAADIELGVEVNASELATHFGGVEINGRGGGG